jgi:polyisoprenoid-binding protein YceI
VRYQVVDAESRVEISGKSSLHPIHGQLRPGSLTGSLTLADDSDEPAPAAAPEGHLELPITALSFGNAMYDRELPKRVEAGRYPTVTLRLDEAKPDGEGTWRVTLSLTVHGVTKSFQEAVRVSRGADGKLTVSGSHRFDVRDFDIQPPKMFGMKVHPDFEVTVHAVGTPAS